MAVRAAHSCSSMPARRKASHAAKRLTREGAGGVEAPLTLGVALPTPAGESGELGWMKRQRVP